jgi:ATP-binding cassette subfamily B protein
MFAAYRRVFAYLLPYWRRLILVLAVSLLSTALSLAQPYIAKLLIDEALLRRNLRALFAVAALMLAVAVLGFALNILSSYRYVKVSAEVLFNMRLALYQHLQALSPRFYARTRLGEIVSRINNDIGEIQRVSADTFLSLLASLAFLLGSTAIMLSLNWRLFLVSITLLPFSALVLRHYQQRLTVQVRNMRQRSADIGSFLIESLTGMRLVVASHAEQFEVARFRNRNRAFIDALLAMQLTSYLAGALPGTMLTLATAAVFLYGGKLVIDGVMTVGGLVAFMAYHLRLLAPVQNLMGLYASLATARVSLDRVFELMDMRIEVLERPGAVPLENVRGEIEFDSVTFRHDRDVPVLENVSFRIAPGAICVIAGESGVGKSTIADLILRFYDPDAGSIRLDGRDLRDVQLLALRSEIALVDQSPFLMHASIAENIAYARPQSTHEQVVEAARSAAIHNFIETLPEKYDTLVGERGLALSAGERHRIAIARALMRRPSVLVLDEPTAALDQATAAELRTLLVQLMRGRTMIVITHSLELMDIADQVIMLKGGRIAELAPRLAAGNSQ